MKVKICNKCKEEKDIILFSLDRHQKDGHVSRCKSCIKEIDKINKKIYYKENKDKLKKSVKEYRDNNDDKIKKYKKSAPVRNRRNNILKSRRENDQLFRLKENIKTSIKNSFRSKIITKNNKSELILGCAFEDFKLYLELKFEHWMTWDNYGKYNGQLNYGWDIDHIIPLDSAMNEIELIKLNHYTNLQPLCSHTNRNIKRNIV